MLRCSLFGSIDNGEIDKVGQKPGISWKKRSNSEKLSEICSLLYGLVYSPVDETIWGFYADNILVQENRRSKTIIKTVSHKKDGNSLKLSPQPAVALG